MIKYTFITEDNRFILYFCKQGILEIAFNPCNLLFLHRLFLETFVICFRFKYWFPPFDLVHKFNKTLHRNPMRQ